MMIMLEVHSSELLHQLQVFYCSYHSPCLTASDFSLVAIPCYNFTIKALASNICILHYNRSMEYIDHFNVHFPADSSVPLLYSVMIHVDDHNALPYMCFHHHCTHT